MGRFLSSDASSGAVSGTAISAENGANIFKMPALTAIDDGDLVVHLEGGNVIPYTSDMNIANSNNNTAGPVAVNTRSIDGTSSGGSVFDVLSNGNFAAVRISTNDIKLIIYTPGDYVAFLEQTIATHAGASQCAIAAFGDQFVVAVSDASGNCWYTIFNNDGTVAVAEKTFASGAATLSLGALGLSAASFIIYYKEGGTQATYFRRFDATGTIQGAATSINANTAALCGDGPFSDGSFLFTVQTNGNTQRAVKFSAAGAQVFDQQTSASTGINVRIAGRGCAVELTDGNFATTIGTAGDARSRAIVIHKTTGATLYTYDPGATASAVRYGRVAVNSKEGGFVFLTQNGTAVYMTKLTNAAAQIRQDQVVTTLTSATYYPLDAFEVPGIGFVVLAFSTDNASSHQVAVKTISYAASAIGSQVNLAQGNNGWTANYKARLNTRMLHIESCPSSQYSVTTYNMYRSSIFGVASGAAAKGQNATVKTSGYFRLNKAAQVTASGTGFDATANTVTGVKGKFVGNNIILNGITA